nr:hypothetical protein [uncultured Janthinobacterium sp.]
MKLHYTAKKNARIIFVAARPAPAQGAMVQHRPPALPARGVSGASSYHLDIHSNNKSTIRKTSFYYAINARLYRGEGQ